MILVLIVLPLILQIKKLMHIEIIAYIDGFVDKFIASNLLYYFTSLLLFASDTIRQSHPYSVWKKKVHDLWVIDRKEMFPKVFTSLKAFWEYISETMPEFLAPKHQFRISCVYLSLHQEMVNYVGAGSLFLDPLLLVYKPFLIRDL